MYLLSAPHGTPTAPHIEPVEVEENTPLSVKCGGDVGYPFGVLQLVSNSTRLDGFEYVSEGCGALVPTCYLLERQPIKCQFTGDLKSAFMECSWDIPRADVSADGMALWCRAKNHYSGEDSLYSIPTTLRVHCMHLSLTFRSSLLFALKLANLRL